MLLLLLLLLLAIDTGGVPTGVQDCRGVFLNVQDFIAYKDSFKDKTSLRRRYEPGGYNNTVHKQYPVPKCLYNFVECSAVANAEVRCLEPNRLCNSETECWTAEDEHKCGKALCQFRKQPGQRLKEGTESTFDSYINDVDEAACAKICLEIENCTGFAYNQQFSCDFYFTDFADQIPIRAAEWDFYVLRTKETCFEDQFQCSAKECVPLSWLCDGQKDCSNGRDEALCDIIATYYMPATSDQQEAKYYKRYEEITYAACAYKCEQDKSSCISFWYSETRRECGLVCDIRFNCPTSKNLQFPAVYQYYISTILSSMQALKVAVKKVGRIVGLKSEIRRQGVPSVNEAIPNSCYASKHIRDMGSICGISKKSGIEAFLYVTATEGRASRETYPWQVQVRRRQGRVFIHACGGAIISEFHIITAAHCIYASPSDLEVVVGQEDASNSAIEEEEQTFKVAELEKHLKHIFISPKRSNDYDIGIITVRAKDGKGIQFGKFVKPVCLPCKNATIEDHEMCKVSGFGLTLDHNTGEEVESPFLQGIDLPVLSKQECLAAYQSRGMVFSELLGCAGGVNGSFCRGDSGGPLACNRNGRYTLMGLVHSGTSDCDPTPGIFLRIESFIDFIEREVSNIEVTV